MREGSLYTPSCWRGLPERCDLESVGCGLPDTDKNGPGITDQEGERPTPLSKLSFDKEDINIGFDFEFGKRGDWKFQKQRCKSRRPELLVIGDGWNPQVSVFASRSTSVSVVGSYMKIQRSEAGCKDDPWCDEAIPGPTIGRLAALRGRVWTWRSFRSHAS